MTKLSPAAQAILDAVDNVPINVDWWPKGMPDLVAAALRAAADQVVPPSAEREFYDRNPSLVLLKAVEIRTELLAIADELETQ